MKWKAGFFPLCAPALSLNGAPGPGLVVKAAGGTGQGTEDPGAHLAVVWPRSSSSLASRNLALLSADHSTGNLFEMLPGYVAYVVLNNAFGILL